MKPVVHFDIPVTDPVKSAAFYKELFDWNIQEVPQMNYWMVYTTETDQATQGPKNPGAINGGLGRRSDAGDISQPYFTVQVDDIQATLGKVVAGGGKIIRPLKDMGEWGKMAVFADTDGNVMGLHSK